MWLAFQIKIRWGKCVKDRPIYRSSAKNRLLKVNSCFFHNKTCTMKIFIPDFRLHIFVWWFEFPYFDFEMFKTISKRSQLSRKKVVNIRSQEPSTLTIMFKYFMTINGVISAQLFPFCISKWYKVFRIMWLSLNWG